MYVEVNWLRDEENVDDQGWTLSTFQSLTCFEVSVLGSTIESIEKVSLECEVSVVLERSRDQFHDESPVSFWWYEDIIFFGNTEKKHVADGLVVTKSLVMMSFFLFTFHTQKKNNK